MDDPLDFTGHTINYKVTIPTMKPVLSVWTIRSVPCGCVGWRARLARVVGRHPRTHLTSRIVVSEV